MTRRLLSIIMCVFLAVPFLAPEAFAATPKPATTTLPKSGKVVTSSGVGLVNLRKGPGNSPVVGKVRAGDIVEIIQKSGQWYQVKRVTPYAAGYIYQSFLSFDVEEPAEADPVVPSFNAATDLGATGSLGYIKGQVKLRSGASTKYGVKATLLRGTRLVVLSQGAWCKVQVIGTAVTGYVQSAAVGAGLSGVTMGGKVSFRSGPGEKYKILWTLMPGTKLTVLSMDANWSRVKIGDTYGYLYNKYFRVL